METALLIIHALLAIILIIVVLIQRAEGGALGDVGGAACLLLEQLLQPAQRGDALLCRCVGAERHRLSGRARESASAPSYALQRACESGK